MVTWDEAADWYLGLVQARDAGFNDLAADIALGMADDPAGRDVLDLGCGEGHVARRLARAGSRVVGVEPVDRLLQAARAVEERDRSGVRYHAGRADDLGFLRSSSFDVVVAVLVMHHVGDLPAALAEIARVLRPGGRLVAVLPHPWSDHPGARWVTEEQRPRRVVGDYLDEGFWHDPVGSAADVSSIRHIGWHHRTVATWINALTAAGLAVTQVAEPAGVAPERADGGGAWRSTPRFLALAAVT